MLLRQIAQNLIINALKYSTGPKVVVGLKHDRGDAWLTVQDLGPGIDPADHERIFNEFERLSRSDAPGSGLGLSIVRRACQQLGHAVALDSAPGHGSRFRVRLPVIAGRQAITEAPALPRAIDTAADLVGRRILVVENDPAMRVALAMLLRAWGMEVAEAAGVDEATTVVREGTVPDVVLTDYRLDAEETGIHAIEAIREDLGEPVPAAIVSAEGAEVIRRLAEPLDVPVLEKPVREGELRRVLRALLVSLG